MNDTIIEMLITLLGVQFLINVLSNSPEDRYIEQFLNYVIESDDFSIGFTGDSNALITISRPRNPYSYDLNLPLFKEFEGLKIFCYGNPNVCVKDKKIRTNIDFLFSIFFFLSRYYEHINPHIRDGHGRFPGIASFQALHNMVEIPVVNQYVSLLVNLIRKAGNHAEIREQYRKPYFSLTHDIDHLSSSMFTRVKEFQKNKRLRKLIKNHFDVNRLIDFEKDLGINSSYYFMLSKNCGAGYNLSTNSKLISELADSIKSIGCNTGVHYSYWTLEKSIDKGLLMKLGTILGETPKNGRHHFLRFDVDRSYRILDDTGILVDTSGGYADMIGFRFGTSWPFRPFDFANKCAHKVWEIPLLVMDITLSSSAYMNLKPEEGFERITKLMSQVNDYGGIFSLLWHNSSFEYGEWKDWEWVYLKTLEKAKQSGYNFIRDVDILKIFEDCNGQ